MGVLVVEQRDRLTRFGYGYIATFLEHEGRHVEAVFPTDTGDDLVDDFMAVITSRPRVSTGDGTPSGEPHRFRHV